MISKQTEDMKKELKCVLREGMSVAVTLDIWSDRTKRGFLGITCHFEQDERLRTKVLATRRIAGLLQYFAIWSSKLLKTLQIVLMH